MQTSALDTHTEQALLSHINSILKEKSRTSVFIAHRLRTIYDCDLIIVLQAGHVAESGTHEQLIDRAGLYSELWSGKNLYCYQTKGRVANSSKAQETLFTGNDDESQTPGHRSEKTDAKEEQITTRP